MARESDSAAFDGFNPAVYLLVPGGLGISVSGSVQAGEQFRSDFSSRVWFKTKRIGQDGLQFLRHAHDVTSEGMSPQIVHVD
jgi:hypothetical protein